MLDLVSTMDRFLHAERLRQGRVEVSLQSIDLGEFLYEQRRGIARQMRGMEKLIAIEIQDQNLRLTTDREMLTLVIQNTLGNCLKYCGDQPVSVRAYRLSASSQDGSLSGGTSFRVEIKDNGPGISPELQERLFEPFVRGPETGRPGTGLGLYIAKQAADLLRARLRVQSAPGAGTTFILDLPDYIRDYGPPREA